MANTQNPDTPLCRCCCCSCCCKFYCCSSCPHSGSCCFFCFGFCNHSCHCCHAPLSLLLILLPLLLLLQNMKSVALYLMTMHLQQPFHGMDQHDFLPLKYQSRRQTTSELNLHLRQLCIRMLNPSRLFRANDLLVC